MIKSLTPSPRRGTHRHGAFTLVEVLVAVAIMSLLFAVILVPLRLGFDTFHIGTARSEVQQQAQLTLQQIGNDFRSAQFVFPNSRVTGVSDNQDVASPCSVPGYKSSWNYQPYVKKSDATDGTGSPSTPLPPSYGVCDSSVEAWSNPARIDMLQVRRDDTGAPLNSTAGQDFIVSYYTRRLDITKPYDIIDNPIVLWRAQIPFRNRISSEQPGNSFDVDTETPPNKNANINWTSYPDTIGTCDASTGESDRSFLWITHNFYGEADLEPLAANDATGGVAGAHTLATPRGMGLVVPRANTNIAEGLVPELSFIQESTNGKRIDRVTVNLTLAQYDQGNAASSNGEAKAQRVRVSQTFDLPSAGCSP